MIHDEVLNFYNWILCDHELFHDKVKTLSNISVDLYLWYLNQMKIISPEYANDHYLWTLWTLNYVHFFLSFPHIFCVVYNRALCNLKKLCFQISEEKNMIKTSLIQLMYFVLLANSLNYVAFDEALALPHQLKK